MFLGKIATRTNFQILINDQWKRKFQNLLEKSIQSCTQHPDFGPYTYEGDKIH